MFLQESEVSLEHRRLAGMGDYDDSRNVKLVA